jgi:hypothetical protein
MDAFWDTVRAHPQSSLPCLRAALEHNTDDSYFRFDGAALLMSIDSSRSSKELQVAAAEHVDLGDVALADWMHLLVRRAVEGFNTIPAASRWFALPDSVAAYYPPEHGGNRISRSEGALFLFGSLPESLATPYLASVVRNDSSRQREIALWLLTQQATPAAREFLRSVSTASLSSDVRQALAKYLEPQRTVRSTRVPTITRDEFMQAFRALHSDSVALFEALVKRVPDGEKDAALVLHPEDLQEVRFARRYFLLSGTPEAIGYYGDFTDILEAVQSRSNSK